MAFSLRTVEDTPANTSLLTGNAASGQKVCAVVTSSAFTVGDSVQIWDSTPQQETNTVASISANNVTMSTNLTYTYTTAKSAKVTVVGGIYRILESVQ